MSPLHHHFELDGWPETKVTARFWMASLVVGGRGLVLVTVSVVSSNTTGSFDATEKVLVIGLGRSGRASVDVLRRRGAMVLCHRRKALRRARRDRSSELEKQGVAFVAPARSIEDSIGDVTAACSRPASRSTASWCGAYRPDGIPVFSEIEVAYRICKAPDRRVTGTKGKTTTTALIGEIFRHAGHKTRVGGNIGNR